MGKSIDSSINGSIDGDNSSSIFATTMLVGTSETSMEQHHSNTLIQLQKVTVLGMGPLPPYREARALHEDSFTTQVQKQPEVIR